MELAERIYRARKNARLTQKQLGDYCGVKSQTVSQWESGKIQKLEGTNLLSAAKALGVSPEWLATGTGQMRDTEIAERPGNYAMFSLKNGDQASNLAGVPFKTGEVPLISWVQAGDWSEATDPFQPGDAEAWHLCPVAHGPHTFILRVRGESMEPEYHDGDWIFVDPDRQAENGSHIIAREEHDKEATFKKLVIEGDRRYLVALNPAWPNRVREIDHDATIIGVVIFSGKPR